MSDELDNLEVAEVPSSTNKKLVEHFFGSMIFRLGSRKSYVFCKSIGSPYVPPALDLLLQQLLHQVEEP